MTGSGSRGRESSTRLRAAAVVVFAVLALGAAGAIAGAPMAIAGIHVYQRSLAPLVGRVIGPCRFTPTCSHYAETVVRRDGLLQGGWLTAKRIVRCGPWTRAGTVDEP